MLKEQTRESYNDRLNRVFDYVYAHLEDDVSFDRLAEVACLSPYHWSRIYSAMRGETIAATIRRLRLQRAADRLANSDLEIGAIAARAGYSSTDTFGRAFKDAFGVSPAAYRERGSHAAFKAANAASDARGFPVMMETLPERRCAGIDHTGSYMEIDHAMGRLFTELAACRALPAQPAMIGVFFDDPDLGPEQALRSRACLPVQEMVRIASPFTHLVRTATRDHELHGKQIKEGDIVAMLFAAGNFDERVFHNPNEFDLGRIENPHVSFGRGAHKCLGQHVAALEMKILFEELFQRTSDIRPAGPINYVRDAYSRGVYELPVTVTPA